MIFSNGKLIATIEHFDIRKYHCQYWQKTLTDTVDMYLDILQNILIFVQNILIFSALSMSMVGRCWQGWVVDEHFVPNHPENDIVPDKGHQPWQKTNITGRREREGQISSIDQQQHQKNLFDWFLQRVLPASKWFQSVLSLDQIW